MIGLTAVTAVPRLTNSRFSVWGPSFILLHLLNSIIVIAIFVERIRLSSIWTSLSILKITEDHKETTCRWACSWLCTRRGPEIGPERTRNSYEFHAEIRLTQEYLPRAESTCSDRRNQARQLPSSQQFWYGWLLTTTMPSPLLMHHVQKPLTSLRTKLQKVKAWKMAKMAQQMVPYMSNDFWSQRRQRCSS